MGLASLADLFCKSIFDLDYLLLAVLGSLLLDLGRFSLESCVKLDHHLFLLFVALDIFLCQQVTLSLFSLVLEPVSQVLLLVHMLLDEIRVILSVSCKLIVELKDLLLLLHVLALESLVLQLKKSDLLSICLELRLIVLLDRLNLSVAWSILAVAVRCISLINGVTQLGFNGGLVLVHDQSRIFYPINHCFWKGLDDSSSA